MKNKMSVVIISSVSFSVYLAYVYYSNKHFAFNAEFIVLICFLIFVSLSYSTLSKLFTESMDGRASEIGSQYKQLRNTTIDTYVSMINNLTKYNALFATVTNLFIFLLNRTTTSYTVQTISHIKEYYSYIRRELSSLVAINTAYISYTRYYFIKSFALELQKEESCNNQLVAFLNTVNFLQSISNRKKATNSKQVIIVNNV